ncbi:MAG: MG2 domain-containing protein [Polyangiaceae bacterium]|nr:MG2 domain-containing protein [Polyangiaceae bacterium]
MNRRAAFALAGLVTIITVGYGCRSPEAPPVGIEATSQGTLLFPPPDDDWSDRAPLPSEDSDVRRRNDVVTVSSPQINDKNHFEFEGSTLSIRFSETLFSNDDLKKAPNLQITPAVKGRTTWQFGWGVEFDAEHPFDPDVEYTVTLPAMTSPLGHMFAGLNATFKATPTIEIAGKTIHYLPKPGEARAIFISPRAEKIGGSQEITIIYDQPIDLALASRLVTLTGSGNTPIATSVAHLRTNTFDGVKVDRRMVVVVTPKVLQAPGTKVQIAAAAQKPEDEKKTLTDNYEVAKPPTIESLDCGGYFYREADRQADCEVQGTKFLKMPFTANIQVKYSNRLLDLQDDATVGRVHITPTPENRYVRASSSEGLVIGGHFLPSTKYTVRVDAMRDAFGGMAAPASFTFQTRPLPTSATLSEGIIVLDGAAIKAFPVTTRNVVKADLLLWPLPKGDTAAFAHAVTEAKASRVPDASPVTIPLLPAMKRDKLVESLIDVSAQLEVGRAYVAKLQVTEPLTDARPLTYPEGSRASQPPVAVLFAAGPNALGAHIHRAGSKAAVQVFRLASGEPVPGAKVACEGSQGATDDAGLALIAVPTATNAAALAAGGDDNVMAASAANAVVAISTNDAELMVPVSGKPVVRSSELFSDLSSGEGSAAGDVIGMLVTDRGVYRPGSKMFLKAFTRKLEDVRISPLAHAKVRLRIVDPTDNAVVDDAFETGERGWTSREIAFDKTWHTGRYAVKLELDDTTHTVIAQSNIRVAEFVAPKFKVDVEPRGNAAADKKVEVLVRGRYLFGAPMEGAHVAWVVSKEPAPISGGALAEAGLVFGQPTWERPVSGDALQPVTGGGTLEKDGTLAISSPLGALAGGGPTEITVEADVYDASNRHVAGQYHTVVDPFERHAGLKLPSSFGDANKPLRVELGVVDSKGNAITGAKVKARIDRLTWTRTAGKAESGATIEQWKNVASTIGACEVVSAITPTSCELPVGKGGSYRITTSIDGRDGASSWYWAAGPWDETEPSGVPSAGKTVQLVLDRAKYKSGDVAKIFVPSPYSKATALLTVEQGGILRQESKRFEGRSVTFDIPLSAANAPWTHAVVTLLPIGETEADYRVGAVRIPVSAADEKLDVLVSSAKKQYEAKDDAEISIEVTKGGAPVKNADVTLAVVDEGVLRMTSFHAIDPSTELRKGRALDFFITDSRGFMITRRDKAHVAGGGGPMEPDTVDVRKNFVETAAWLPNLTTDESGRVSAKVKLPDNLTEFRMMAVVLDDLGRGGSAESSFTVTKSLMLEPVMPRFALRGDTFEAAAMVHNNTDAAVQAKVTVADQVSDVTLAPHDSQRVSAKMVADRTGTRSMRFLLESGGKAKDVVEIPLRIDEPGIKEHPMISGAFTENQEVRVAIPGDATFDDDAAMSIKVGSALYPELGKRIGYLLDYPHGCVEQTTSSTLPLLAARTILPWAAAAPMDDAEIRKRIEAGVARLATMETPMGGLGYWPGDSEPNVYGTAYAMTALVRAKEIGIEKPKLIDHITKYLVTQLESGGETPNVRVAIAAVLAQSKALPESSADSLYDALDKLDVFGLGSLALALSSLPKQEDRVKEVLDKLEASFKEDGTVVARKHGEHDWAYWGSEDRDRAQALIALNRLRKNSKLALVLASRLVKGIERWTTQSTAWSLTALADTLGTRSPKGGVNVTVRVDGKAQETFRSLGGDNKEVRVPLRELRGKVVTLTLKGNAKIASAFAIDAQYKRPLNAAGTRLARRGPVGLSIHRVFSNEQGDAIDLANVKAGDIVRVALRIELPKITEYRLGYLAVIDRLPAGFEPIDPNLSTTASLSSGKSHPFSLALRGSMTPPSHIDLRDDKVQIYFNHVFFGPYSSDRAQYATYLVRATTPGTFTLPPASGELMYEPGSDGYSDAAIVHIQ